MTIDTNHMSDEKALEICCIISEYYDSIATLLKDGHQSMAVSKLREKYPYSD